MKSIELVLKYYGTSGVDIPESVQKLIATTERLGKSFKKYSRHRLGCNSVRILDSIDCPCGYRKALKDIL